MTPRRDPRPPVGSERGTGLLWFHAFLVWVATVLAVAVVDVSAYLVAAARAQTAADSAALAAVSADATSRTGRDDPRREVEAVLRRADARLERCDCHPGRGRAEVHVSVAVPGLVVPRAMGMRRVTARGEAVLAPPDPDAPRARDLGPPPPRHLEPAGGDPSPRR